MGHGDYSHAAHEALARGRARAGASQQVFAQTQLPPAHEPERRARAREPRQRRAPPVARHRLRARRHGIDGRHPAAPRHRAAPEVHEGPRRTARCPTHRSSSWPSATRSSDRGAAPGRPVRVDRRAHGPVAHVELPRRRRRRGPGVLRAGALLPRPAHRDGLLREAEEARLPLHDGRRAPVPEPVANTSCGRRPRRPSSTTT